MIQTITKIGDSRGIVFDANVLELSHLQVGDKVSVEVSPDGSISIVPLGDEVFSEEEAAEKAIEIIGQNSELFRRLS